MKKKEKKSDVLIKRSKVRRISKAQSLALPEIKTTLKAEGFTFSDSYIYRVLAGTDGLYNEDILRIANPIVESYVAKLPAIESKRAELEAQRNKHLQA
jgi:hypothetical protein